MKYAETGSGTITHITSFKQIVLGIQYLRGGGEEPTDTDYMKVSQP
jgi:hypothetical protein